MLGGKDRHPYPVPIRVYDEVIHVLISAVQQASLERGAGKDEVALQSARGRPDARTAGNSCSVHRLSAS